MTRLLLALLLVLVFMAGWTARSLAAFRPASQTGNAALTTAIPPVAASEGRTGAPPRDGLSFAGQSHPRGAAGGAPPTLADARAYGLRVLGSVQYACLDRIITYESRWRVTARNRRSGAYGLGQALPASKMAPFGADYLTNPLVQVRWAIFYASRRYGSACGGLDHIRRVGWW